MTAVEDDPVWYDKVRQRINSVNVRYELHTEKGPYVAAPAAGADIFVVDGKFRRQCAERIVALQSAATPTTMLIVDNADWHPNTMAYLRDTLAWVQVDFHGFGPINSYTWTTSLFINPEQRHKLVYRTALQSRSGLVQTAADD